MRRLAATVLILSLAAVVAGCGLPPCAEKTEKFSGTVFGAFDTVITVTAYCADKAEFDSLLSTAQSEFTRLHRLFDIYFTYPELTNLRTVNDSAGKPVAVPPEIIELLSLAKEMYALTDGAVNVAMGSVLRIWHDVREFNTAMPEDKRLPELSELRAAAEHCSIEALVIDPKAGTVCLKDPEMRLDVGAVAKGYATERVCDTLRELGCEHFVINAGGNVRCVGGKPDGSAWNVAVTDPQSPGGTLGILKITDGSAVTSGSYQRFFELDGRRYHHIIDGTTLMPENTYLSVTVCAESSATADALSTAFFNTAPEKALPLAASLEGVEALWVMADGTELTTDGFRMTE